MYKYIWVLMFRVWWGLLIYLGGLLVETLQGGFCNFIWRMWYWDSFLSTI